MKMRTLATACMLGFMAIGLGAAGGDGCTSNVQPSSDQRMNQAQERLANEATMQVGMPAIVNFAEKRMMKDILELRDQMKPTYAYLVDMNGHVGDKICDSVGYGLPYAAQFTNPSKIVHLDGMHENQYQVVPQADPNGLFSPSTADGTWVLCKDPDPKSTKVLPLYIEPRVIVSPFKLK